VFGPLPGTGRWRHILLADGNIGIGGDPARLLRRCRHLLAPDGRVHIEAAAPGTPAWSGPAVVKASPDSPASPRPAAAKVVGPGESHDGVELMWACVPIDDLPALADAIALRLLHTWTEAGRWFATATPR
jgi:hypothetical protein